MSEYINKSIINNKLIPLYKELSFIHPKQAKGIMMAIKKLEEQPTAEVEVVRHGKWIKDEFDNIICSECKQHPIENEDGYQITELKEYKPFYCPNCGAKMDIEGYENCDCENCERLCCDNCELYEEAKIDGE